MAAASPPGTSRRSRTAAIFTPRSVRSCPRESPTYVNDVVAVSRPEGRILADLRSGTAPSARVEISANRAPHGYRWETTGVEGTALHWDARARAWERIPQEA